MHKIIRNVGRRLLPKWLYFSLINRWDAVGLKKYTSNTIWLLIARTISFITSFLTIAVVARYLGPDNLGKLSYAQSFVSILSVLAALGIDQILYRDLVAKPEQTNEIIGTAIYAKFFAGLASFIISILISLSIGNEPILTLLIAITAFTFIINPIGTIGILFQARVQAKYSSYIAIFLAFFIPATKLLIVFFDKGIIYFSLILILEAFITSLWSLYIYVKKLKLSPSKWDFDIKIFKELMHDSWPFLLAGIFGYIYARIDQVMLQHYLNSTAVGLYDSAVKLTNIWSFFPALIITSLFPAVVNAKKLDHNVYLKRYYQLTIFTFIITLIIAVIVFITASPLVLLVFGQEYLGTVGVLKIYIWSSLSNILTTLILNYLVTENKGYIHLILAIISAVANVVLNLYLIPKYGIQGAAYSTVISNLLIPIFLFLFPSIRKNLTYHKHD